MLIHMHKYVRTSTQRFVFKFILTSRITLFASKELWSYPYLYITNKKRPSCRQLVHLYIFQKSIYSLATIVFKIPTTDYVLWTKELMTIIWICSLFQDITGNYNKFTYYNITSYKFRKTIRIYNFKALILHEVCLLSFYWDIQQYYCELNVIVFCAYTLKEKSIQARKIVTTNYMTKSKYKSCKISLVVQNVDIYIFSSMMMTPIKSYYQH